MKTHPAKNRAPMPALVDPIDPAAFVLAGAPLRNQHQPLAGNATRRQPQPHAPGPAAAVPSNPGKEPQP